MHFKVIRSTVRICYINATKTIQMYRLAILMKYVLKENELKLINRVLCGLVTTFI